MKMFRLTIIEEENEQKWGEKSAVNADKTRMALDKAVGNLKSSFWVADDFV